MKLAACKNNLESLPRFLGIARKILALEAYLKSTLPLLPSLDSAPPLPRGTILPRNHPVVVRLQYFCERDVAVGELYEDIEAMEATLKRGEIDPVYAGVATLYRRYLGVIEQRMGRDVAESSRIAFLRSETGYHSSTFVRAGHG